MVRNVLIQELRTLDDQIKQLGSMVEDALTKALEAVETGDQTTSGLVIEADALIDSLRAAIEQHSIRILTLQQPLGARDLRYLTSALSIAGDLERVGDGAAGIAQIVLRMAPLYRFLSKQEVEDNNKVDHLVNRSVTVESQLTEDAILKNLLELGKAAQEVLHKTMAAFANGDGKAARYIWEEDEMVDIRYRIVRHDLMGMLAGAHAIPALQKDTLVLQRATYLLWIAHKLERVADHATNICERIVFSVEGETIPPSLPKS